MANDRSKIFFNVLVLENILVALTIEIGDGPCFLYIEFSWIGVERVENTLRKISLSCTFTLFVCCDFNLLYKKYVTALKE
jgi:hypothetical protein